MKVLAMYAIKGGVGKTSAAVNLAHLAAVGGVRTLLWDLDPQGSATYLLRIRPRVKGGGKALVTGRRVLDDAIKGTDYEGLDLMPADFTYRSLDLELDALKKPTRRLRRLLDPLSAEYDLVILDCPPSVSLTSESVVHAADLLAVPLIPAYLSLRSFDQLVGFLEALDVAGHDGARVRRPDVLAFLSMVDRRKKLHRELAVSLPRDVASVCAVSIPALSAIEQMAERREPVTASAPRGPAATAYAQLWTEVAGRLGVASPGGQAETG
jgi:cellulose biosynthesis protein BcsQ